MWQRFLSLQKKECLNFFTHSFWYYFFDSVCVSFIFFFFGGGGGATQATDTSTAINRFQVVGGRQRESKGFLFIYSIAHPHHQLTLYVHVLPWKATILWRGPYTSSFKWIFHDILMTLDDENEGILVQIQEEQRQFPQRFARRLRHTHIDCQHTSVTLLAASDLNSVSFFFTARGEYNFRETLLWAWNVEQQDKERRISVHYRPVETCQILQYQPLILCNSDEKEKKWPPWRNAHFKPAVQECAVFHYESIRFQFTRVFARFTCWRTQSSLRVGQVRRTRGNPKMTVLVINFLFYTFLSTTPEIETLMTTHAGTKGR